MKLGITIKDKAGNPLTPSEFMSRWRKGIQGVTPLQQTHMNLIGMIIVLVGIFSGLLVTAFTNIWWLFIILIGSLFVSGTNLLGTYQRYLALKKIEEVLKGGSENVIKK